MHIYSVKSLCKISQLVPDQRRTTNLNSLTPDSGHFVAQATMNSHPREEIVTSLRVPFSHPVLWLRDKTSRRDPTYTATHP